MHIILHDVTVYVFYIFILKIYTCQLWRQLSSDLPFGNHFPGKWRSGKVTLSGKRLYPGRIASSAQYAAKIEESNETDIAVSQQEFVQKHSHQHTCTWSVRKMERVTPGKQWN